MFILIICRHYPVILHKEIIFQSTKALGIFQIVLNSVSLLCSTSNERTDQNINAEQRYRNFGIKHNQTISANR